jgi:hypothetical protein
VKILVPVPIAPLAPENDRAPDRRLDRPPVLGVIDDGFGVVLLPGVLDDLRARLGIEDVVYHRKPNLSAVTEDAVLADLDERCRAVVVGVCA